MCGRVAGRGVSVIARAPIRNLFSGPEIAGQAHGAVKEVMPAAKYFEHNIMNNANDDTQHTYYAACLTLDVILLDFKILRTKLM